MAYGALIEGAITLISRVVALESGYWTTQLSITANAVVTTVLVLAGNINISRKFFFYIFFLA